MMSWMDGGGIWQGKIEEEQISRKKSKGNWIFFWVKMSYADLSLSLLSLLPRPLPKEKRISESPLFDPPKKIIILISQEDRFRKSLLCRLFHS